VLGAAASIAALLLTGAAATPQEDHAAYVRRDDSMKQLGRDLYISIGRVVQGKIKYSAATVAAAEDSIKVIATLPTLFPPGSNVPQSHLKPELFANKARVDQIIADVQKVAEGLVPAVKTGDKSKIATANKALIDACNACHKEFRTPYE